jgi:hypothetical protein
MKVVAVRFGLASFGDAASCFRDHGMYEGGFNMEWLEGRMQIFAVLLFGFPVECCILFACGFMARVVIRRLRDGN